MKLKTTQTRGASYLREQNHTVNPHADEVAELPACLQPHYLAEVVRSFCGARGLTEANGSDSKVGARLGLYRKTIAKYHRRIFLKRFKANYLAVRQIRGKAA